MGWKGPGEAVPTSGQATPLAELVETAAWIPRSDVLCRKVRKVFLHHVLDPNEEEGDTTVSSTYGYGEAKLSPPALLQWDPRHHESPQGQQIPVPHPSSALVGQNRPTGHTGLEGCRDLAAAEEGSSMQKCQHSDTSRCPRHQPALHARTLPFCLVFLLLFPFSRGKKPKRCLENCGMLPLSSVCSPAMVPCSATGLGHCLTAPAQMQ